MVLHTEPGYPGTIVWPCEGRWEIKIGHVELRLKDESEWVNRSQVPDNVFATLLGSLPDDCFKMIGYLYHSFNGGRVLPPLIADKANAIDTIFKDRAGRLAQTMHIYNDGCVEYPPEARYGLCKCKFLWPFLREVRFHGYTSALRHTIISEQVLKVEHVVHSPFADHYTSPWDPPEYPPDWDFGPRNWV